MSISWIVIALILGFVIVFQIAKASEYVSILRGEEKTRKENNRINAFLLLAFLIAGLIGVWYCNERLKGKILGEAASNHGERIDSMLWITLAITGIVFVITQVLLFWFAYKYQEKEGRKAFYYPHNNKLELIWTVIPAITLTILVGFGLYYWFQITGDAPKDAQVVEVWGKQFNWEFRYPGKDGQFGKRYYKEINEATANPLGQIWSDPANHDDIYTTGEVHIVVGKPVKFVINAKDVIHDVGLVHFRMKMDAVPGIPTTMWFTPKWTTKQMRDKYGPDFNYEISCDQMCGKGHFSMRGTVLVETQEEFNAWIATKQPQYTAFMDGAKQSPAAEPGKMNKVAGDTATKAVADTTKPIASLKR
ncbi:cytochrome c oxidase subunit II [Flaviaesturariibacter aridisoli]|uniref:Cytochrome c oxidase subunit 2 n=1 Tax=Flaviaesturariibacter aridisoli TaxID=2545761 RepID=A0A4R4E4A3_9BACT|nr:cytochrome c oxidase subunit II [Flaviaesturariibacter aridisoli]TCZ72811.1 cytochrome c oxidase subunit II [Flaviaesturariibacter aridisoli]